MAKRSTRVDIIAVGSTWLVLTVALEALVIATVEPTSAARESEIVDSAFWLLAYLGIPVFTFVLVALVYSVVRFRASGTDEDGSAARSHRGFITAWVAITAALAVFVIITPGYTGLAELAAEPDADVDVEVVASQWNWSFTFPDEGVTLLKADEILLPVDTRVRFRVTSEDVIHSFWVPAFRIKVDAVPGMFTETMVTPTELGDFAANDQLRVQCAELCGTGHARMRTIIRVVDRVEFNTWLAGLAAGAG